MSSFDSGKSASTSSTDMPEARYSSTSVTVMRSPRAHGFPPRLPGSSVRIWRLIHRRILRGGGYRNCLAGNYPLKTTAGSRVKTRRMLSMAASIEITTTAAPEIRSNCQGVRKASAEFRIPVAKSAASPVPRP